MIVAKPYRTISHDAECTLCIPYNVSSQPVSGAKGTFVEILNGRLVMQVGMVNLFLLNSMETQGLLSAKPSALFCGTGSAV